MVTMSKTLIVLMDDGTLWRKANIGNFAEDHWEAIEAIPSIEKEPKNNDSPLKMELSR